MTEEEPIDEWDIEQVYSRYQELATKCADDVVMGNDPTEKDYYRELHEMFLELAHREQDGEIPEAERQGGSE